ncbi:FAD-binding oxidoreductase [Planctomonas psychrotolerans]|uniref:FAD-binding oxidoreductase n=1 Tax=Planctomonas psychrotolerans TaxID=2528712 RepID=UPI0012385E86|nr:FAD-linked oxidase C-terminal domain-containing protein [Planctomonas psychrotolerans]
MTRTSPGPTTAEPSAAASSAAVLAALREELGAAVSTDPADLDAARTDKSGWRSAGAPLALVNATTVSEVQTTLRIAARTGTPVIPRGAGTGLAAGGVGSTGEIVLSTLGMNRILEVSEADELAVVEPGLINDALNEALAPRGLWYSPDPASKAISSIGGNIATNAGGLLCAKYGVTRESVLGLTVALADGTLLKTGHRTVKGVTGYDLTALMIGSEGTLGVIVEATLRLRPLPTAPPVTIGAFFPDVRRAAAASAAITAARLRPAAMELMDAVSVRMVDSYLGADIGGVGRAFLLIRFDDGAAADDARIAADIVRAQGGTPEVSTDVATGERLLDYRRAYHPALAAVGRVLIEDVAVPRSALAAMFDEIARIEREHGVRIPTVAHAGDGNLHPNFLLDPGIEEVPESIWRAADELFRSAIALGGTLTGEHGVGLLKSRWLEEELGPQSVGLQRAIKAVFDPAGILNPGRVFDAGLALP